MCAPLTAGSQDQMSTNWLTRGECIITIMISLLLIIIINMFMCIHIYIYIYIHTYMYTYIAENHDAGLRWLASGSRVAHGCNIQSLLLLLVVLFYYYYFTY